MRWAIWNRCSSSRNWIWRELELALALDEGLVGAVDHDVADRRVGEQLLERAEAEQLVDQHLFERELLAAVEVDLELGQHLADDRAEFLGELVLAERRGGFGVDALEQARKHLLLDPVDRGFEAFGLAAAPLRRWRSGARSGGPSRPSASTAGVRRGVVGRSALSSSSGGNCSPPLGLAARPGRAAGRPSSAWRRRSSAVRRRLPPRLPNALMPSRPVAVSAEDSGW